MTLTGCANYGNSVSLAPVPGDIPACFNRLVPAPKKGPMTKKDIVHLIGELKKSELSKSRCGKRLIEWYDTQRDVFEGKK